MRDAPVPAAGTRLPGRLVLLGHPVAHSLSPTFQNAALRARGLPLRYEALDVAPAALEETLARLAVERAAGNVTVPHKEAVFTACAHRSPLATRAGAVNTFWHDADGRLVGDNTDVEGARSTIAALFAAQAPHRVVLLGAGGSAGAVLLALEAWPGVEVAVHARTTARAAALLDRLALADAGQVRARVVESADALEEALANAGLVVNTTPLGLTDDALPVAPERLSPSAAVFDLVYRRGGTPWVRAVRASGRRAEDGLGMLVAQGAAAFARWFGDPVPVDAMWRALDDAR